MAKAKVGDRFDPTLEQFNIIETWQPGAGAILKRFRESRGWTTEHLAKLVNCDDSLIGYWEQEKKRPGSARKDALLALMAPRNAVQVRSDGFTTSTDLDALLLKLQSQHDTPIARRFALLDANYEKVLICLIMKATGTILPGVDVKASALVIHEYKEVRRDYELSQQKSGEKRVSKAGAEWLRQSVENPRGILGQALDTPTSSDDVLHNGAPNDKPNGINES